LVYLLVIEAAVENNPTSQTSLSCPVPVDILGSDKGVSNDEELAKSQDSENDSEDKITGMHLDGPKPLV
jgi:hypothetical protein